MSRSSPILKVQVMRAIPDVIIDSPTDVDYMSKTHFLSTKSIVIGQLEIVWTNKDTLTIGLIKNKYKITEDHVFTFILV